MPDIPVLPDDDQELDDFDAALTIGRKVLEMMDRLRPMASITPDAAAVWAVTMDGTRYEVVMTIAAAE